MSKLAKIDVTINDEQIKSRLNDIEVELKHILALKKKALEEVDAKGVIAFDKEAKKLTREFNQLNKQVVDVDKVLKNLSGSSIREIEQALSKANAEMKAMKRNDPGFIEKQGQIKLMRTELDKATSSMKAQQSGLAKLADGFNKYFALGASLVATFTGVIFSVKQAIEEFNNFEERVDNLSALTGLAGEALDWLSDRAKALSTATLESGIRVKQSATEIIDAFTKTGSARPELLQNKEALSQVTEEAIILANASKTELQPAIEALTMVMNQYNVPASEARRIINSIAAGSKAGAGEIPYITTAFEKAGTVAADAGISIETLVATIETLAPRITQPEIAGRSLKGVLLDLQTTADDTNPAMVGFANALENLSKKQLSITELTKLFGAENITTAKILINNVDELRKYEAAVTGTNVAIEQAAINTDNNNAKLAQAKNRLNLITIELGEKLAPAFTFSTNAASYFIKGLAVAADFFVKYGRTIAVATSSIIAYSIALNANAIILRVQYTWLVIVEKAQKLLNITMKSNPVALVAAAVAGLVTWLALYTRQTNDAAEAQKKFNKFLEGTEELMQNTKSIDERAATIDKMSKKQLEKFIEDTQTELAAFDALEEKKLIAAKEYEDAVKLVDARITREAKSEDEKRALYNNKYVTAERDEALQRFTEISQSIDQNKAKLTNYIKLANNAAKTKPDIVNTDTIVKNVNEQIGAYAELTAEISELEKQLKNLIASNQPVPSTLIHELASKKAELEKVNEALISINTQVIELSAKKSGLLNNATPLQTRPDTTDPSLLNADDEGAKNKAIEEAAIATAQNTADAMFELKANARQAELDADLNALDQLREKELSNKNLTEEQKDIINQKYAAKEAALKREAWEKDKQAAITQGLINGALAVTKTFAVYGFTPAGWIAAAGQAVATGLQVAVIKAQKPPQFFAGGYTDDDFNDDKPAGTVHANEFVANAQAKRNPTVRPVLDIIDYAQRSGTIRSINLPAVIASNNNGMKSGGYTSAPGINNSIADQFADNSKMVEASNRFADAVDKLQRDGVQGKWVYQDFKTMADKEQKAISKTN
jgi:TP901 family phage tail tape measure protein